MHVFDLPIEEQIKISKDWGFDSFEEWVAKIKESDEKTEQTLKNARPLTKAQLRQKIKAVQENPNGIHVYRRITGNDELTVADVVKAFEQQLETAPE